MWKGAGHIARSAATIVIMLRRLLGIPDDRRGGYLLALGYPADKPLAPLKKINRRPFEEVVHRGRR